ncbi:hypothetical protein IWQ61_001308 [Dispira simplex]|nr:hypothetical protein IWQ61_001308 [Dispira simplex]
MEDEVVAEFDVFQAERLGKYLTLVQYPLKTSTRFHTDLEVPKATRIKPKNFVLEADFHIDTTSPLYNKERGERFALGFNEQKIKTIYDQDEELQFGQATVMDTQTLASKQIPVSTRYMVGVFKDGELHLTPVERAVQMYPTLKYLDVINNKEKAAKKREDNDEDSPQAKARAAAKDKAKMLQVQVRNPAAEELAQLRKTSVAYLRQQIEEEAWQPLEFYSSNTLQAGDIYNYMFARSKQLLESTDGPLQFLDKMAKETDLEDTSSTINGDAQAL